MGLLTTASSTNRVVDQANTYSFELEPAQQFSSIVAVTDGSSFAVGDKVTVLQWRAIAHFAKRYRYVGLSEDYAATIAATVAAAYVVSMARYSLGLYVDTTRKISFYKFLEVEGAAVPTCCAAVTATHGDGPVWNVEVDVDATVEAYYDTVPSASTINALFEDICNFPEDGGSN